MPQKRVESPLRFELERLAARFERLIWALIASWFLLGRALVGVAEVGPSTAVNATGDPIPAKPRSPTSAEGHIAPSGKFLPSIPAFIQKRAYSSNVPLTNMMGLIPEFLKVEGRGKYRLGLVSLDSNSRTLSFPAQLNMDSGLLEYCIVSRGGKVHESLLVTDVQPLHVHLAALLLGLASTNSGAVVPIHIEVEWRGNGPAKTLAVEELIALREGALQGPDVGVMPKSRWNYTGSVVNQDRFEADSEGSIVSLIGDPVALASCPPDVGSRGKGSTQVFVPNTQKLPPSGLPLTVRIRLATAD